MRRPLARRQLPERGEACLAPTDSYEHGVLMQRELSGLEPLDATPDCDVNAEIKYNAPTGRAR